MTNNRERDHGFKQKFGALSFAALIDLGQNSSATSQQVRSHKPATLHLSNRSNKRVPFFKILLQAFRQIGSPQPVDNWPGLEGLKRESGNHHIIGGRFGGEGYPVGYPTLRGAKMLASTFLCLVIQPNLGFVASPLHHALKRRKEPEAPTNFQRKAYGNKQRVR